MRTHRSKNTPAANGISEANMTAKRALQVQVEGRTIAISNLEKVLYPATGFTIG
jgi:hypothetical protein